MLPFLAETTDKSDLIKPSPGLMIWTLVTFAIVFWVLKKYAFGRIAELLDARREAIRSANANAEEARAEAQATLEEYKAQLAAARTEASQILERARKSGEEQRRLMQEELTADRERGIAAAQAAIQTETRQSLDRIKSEIADLTLAATEAVLRRKLDESEQKALIEEALAGVDFSRFQGETTS